MYPKREEIIKLAKSGEYRRIPIAREILSDSVTTIEVMRILRNASRHCYLLESASQQEVWGRYSFLGYDPTAEITCMDGELRIRRQKNKSGSFEAMSRDENREALKTVETVVKQVKHPGEAIREILSEYKSPKIEGLPVFTGGLVGYFSYDYIKYAEPKLFQDREATEPDEFKDMDLMLFNDVIVFDHYRQKLVFVTGLLLPEEKEGATDEALEAELDNRIEKAKAHLEEMITLVKTGEKKQFQPLKLRSEIKPLFPEEEYCRMVEKAKHYIREGDIFQVVLSDPLQAEAEGSLFDTYRVLRAENPSPYMFYFSSDDIELAGASPETLVKLEDGIASTFPLAGTRPRGKDEEEDKRLEEELLTDDKELAEHNMLVDLGRNDMGKIAEIGSVKVDRYMEILRFSHVMHIGSTVTGKIRAEKDAVDAVDAILPAGTLSGAPKYRACEIIRELEGDKRGVYGGAIGYLDFTGNLDTCIAIRLVYKKNGRVTIRSGAGIVADSVPENEFRECRNKTGAVVRAIETAAAGAI